MNENLKNFLLEQESKREGLLGELYFRARVKSVSTPNPYSPSTEDSATGVEFLGDDSEISKATKDSLVRWFELTSTGYSIEIPTIVIKELNKATPNFDWVFADKSYFSCIIPSTGSTYGMGFGADPSGLMKSFGPNPSGLMKSLGYDVDPSGVPRMGNFGRDFDSGSNTSKKKS